MPQLDNSLFSGFSKLSREQRFQRLQQMGALTVEDINYLKSGGIKDTGLAEKFIENVIGYFQLPLGVATNFNIDGKDYIIPMAVEETSIIAALSKSAKWIRKSGQIQTSISGDCILGQIQIADVSNFEKLAQIIEKNSTFLIEKANEEVAGNMVNRGGGVKTISVRELAYPDKNKSMAIIHVGMDPVDAMGANILNQVLEYLKTPIENLTGETVTMCILSNLNSEKITTAKVIIDGVPADEGERLEQASLFAELDPYRAATHNKGVMNGIDPILIATGNDWRAVEAGIHAFAAKDGQYRAITKWRYENGQLHGQFKAPLIVGTVGGVTSLHPTAQLGLRMLAVTSANELSRIIAAVGLVQNLGALRALVSEGIIQGHMKLHIDNLSLSAGATEQERAILKPRLEQWLQKNKRLSLSNAKQLLAEIRQTSIA